jgi:hypothetical protein
MLTALVLVCSLAVTPDLKSCNRDNAKDVIAVPAQFGNPATCLMHGQAYLASNEFARDFTADERVKVLCTHARMTGSADRAAPPATVR